MSIKIKPVNKTLIVELERQVKNKPDSFGFVIPEKSVLTKHAVVELKAASEGSPYECYVGQKILVLNNMIETLEVKNTVQHIVSETGVVGIITESELF